MKDTAPCKGCEDRFIGCHAVCGHYKAWKKKHDALRAKIRAAKYPEDWIDATKIKKDPEQ